MRYLDVNKLAQAIESRIEEDLTCHRVGGVSVLVSQNGSVVYKKHFGRDSEAFQQTPDDTTMFRLASMTKPITKRPGTSPANANFQQPKVPGPI